MDYLILKKYVTSTLDKENDINWNIFKTIKTKNEFLKV